MFVISILFYFHFCGYGYIEETLTGPVKLKIFHWFSLIVRGFLF